MVIWKQNQVACIPYILISIAEYRPTVICLLTEEVGRYVLLLLKHVGRYFLALYVWKMYCILVICMFTQDTISFDLFAYIEKVQFKFCHQIYLHSSNSLLWVRKVILRVKQWKIISTSLFVCFSSWFAKTNINHVQSSSISYSYYFTAFLVCVITNEIQYSKSITQCIYIRVLSKKIILFYRGTWLRYSANLNFYYLLTIMNFLCNIII